jgi:hypothetical protein
VVSGRVVSGQSVQLSDRTRMGAESASGQALSLAGEVVLIFERGGHRVARVRLEAATIVDISAESLGDVHLGDRIVVSGSLAIARVREEP